MPRVSTLEQEAGLEAQVRDLTALGCEKLYREQVSSVAPRAQLNAVLDFVREGDTLVCDQAGSARPVRPRTLAGSSRSSRRSALACASSTSADTSTPTGKLMLNVMAGVAQFEREMMLERQREGIAKAKGEGRYKGRKPTVQGEGGRDRGASQPGPEHGPPLLRSSGSSRAPCIG